MEVATYGIKAQEIQRAGGVSTPFLPNGSRYFKNALVARRKSLLCFNTFSS